MVSLRDVEKSSNHGYNVSAGLSTNGGDVTGTNGSVGASNGRSTSKQTVLTSVTGETVNVNVAQNTHLEGALISAGTVDENGNFIDNANLNLTTNTLTVKHLTNKDS